MQVCVDEIVTPTHSVQITGIVERWNENGSSNCSNPSQWQHILYADAVRSRLAAVKKKLQVLTPSFHVLREIA